MLRSHLIVAGLVASGLLSVVACGGDDPETGTGGTGGGGTTDQTGKQPASPPDGAGPGDGAGVVLAINKLYLGDTNRDGTPNAANGWKQYGFNLDHLISTKDSKNLCKPRAGGAPSSIYPDGDQGIDNSFGKNILPIILGLAPDASDQLNAGIAEGSFTIMLDIKALGAAASYNPLTTHLYGGAKLAAPPAWDGSDQWPLIPELLNNGNPDDPKVKFASSYVNDNEWVSGSSAPLNLQLSVAGFALNLTIGQAVIATKLGADHKTASEGTIAGIIDTESFIEELRKVAGAFDEGLCSGSTFDSLANQLRQASDIMKDGTQNTAAECDGISIGLGFDMTEVQLGPVAPPADPQPDPCAGTGGAGGN